MSLNGPFINGKWLETGEKFTSVNPATGEPFAEVFAANGEHVSLAFEAAERSFREWSKLPLSVRLEHFKRLKTVLLDSLEEIAKTIAVEQGKPLTEALLVELLPALDSLDYYIHRAAEHLEPLKVRHWQVLFRDKKAHYRFEPIGVVAVISPWNYPFIIPFLDITAALLTGNTVVFKPSSVTPVVGVRIAELFERAGFPDGTVNLLTGRSDVGQAIVGHESTRVIMFTGSVETGRAIYRMAADGVKKIVLELGGKDPAVVMPDADLKRAVNGILWGAFMNAGQTCASIERVYVHRGIYDDFVEMVTELTARLKVGDPLEPSTDIGPMTTASQLQLVKFHVREALEDGAKLLIGGEEFGRGFFYSPAVIVDVNHEMRIMRDETFGPVMPIMKFDSLDEAIALSNDTNYGLTASIWTRDRETASQFIRMVEAGTVTVNDHVFSFGEPEGAWGGVKFSGIGRTHGRFGLLELVNVKFVSEDYSRGESKLWWYPYDERLLEVAKLAGTSMYSESHSSKLRATMRLMRHAGLLLKKVGIKLLALNPGRFI